MPPGVLRGEAPHPVLGVEHEPEEVLQEVQHEPVELQEFAIFAISVAGKSSFVQVRTVDNLIHRALAWTGHADTLRSDRVRVALAHGRPREAMESVRLGQYTRIGRALTEIVDRNLDLRTCTEEDLAAVHGCS